MSLYLSRSLNVSGQQQIIVLTLSYRSSENSQAWIKFCTHIVTADTQRKRVSQPISCVLVVLRSVSKHLTKGHKHRWKRLVQLCVLCFYVITENSSLPWQLIRSLLSFPSFYLFLLQTLHFWNNCRCLLSSSPAIVLQMAINWTKLCPTESWCAVSSAALVLLLRCFSVVRSSDAFPLGNIFTSSKLRIFIACVIGVR